MISVVLGGAVSAAAALSAPTAAIDQSTNWSGYTVTGNGSTETTADSTMAFTDVTGTWKQPAATCTPGDPNSASMWVGLGGYSTNAPALEQTGTEVDCNANGKASYSAWYEIVPQPSKPIKLKVLPGDTITASVYVTNGTDVLVQIKNRTRHTSFTKHITVAAPDLTSAEWIAEAPSDCSESGRCTTTDLANFGSVTFSKIAATGNGQAGTLMGSEWEYTAFQLIPDSRHGRFFRFGAAPSSNAGATPVSPTPDCTAASCSFTVNFVANANTQSTLPNTA
ncbi:MAG: G1 family glutamic endopeptidase [Solirubrobacteraceae bacterium]